MNSTNIDQHEQYGFSANIWLLRLMGRLPFRWLQGLGGFAGFLIYHFVQKPVAIGRRNVAIAFPERSEAEREKLVRQGCISFGRTLAESLYVWAQPQKAAALVKEVIGMEEIQSQLAEGGVLLATPHIGNWEVLGLWGGERFAIPVTSMYKPQKGLADKYIRNARQGTGATLVPSDAAGVRALLRALINGQIAGILPDQDPDWGAGVFAPLFDHPAHTVSLFCKLAAKTQAPAYFCYCERLRLGDGFRAHIVPIDLGVYDDDPVVAATALNRSVEKCIRHLPDQYWWNYARYRRQPDDKPSIYERNT